jgi:hypothetical protein
MTWGSRIVSGARLGLSFAAVYASIATIIVVVSGGRAVEGYRWGWVGVVISYAFGGLMSGALGGFLSPLARSSSRAFAVGVVCSAPTFAAFIVVLGEPLFSIGAAAVIAACSLTVGGACGVIVREIFSEDEQPSANGDEEH